MTRRLSVPVPARPRPAARRPGRRPASSSRLLPLPAPSGTTRSSSPPRATSGGSRSPAASRSGSPPTPRRRRRPAISPDGKTVAYSAAYEGPTEVYTLPLDGGVPVRQTLRRRRARSLSAGRRPGRSSTPRGATPRSPTRSSFASTRRSGRARSCPLAQASDGAYDGRAARSSSRGFAFQGSHTQPLPRRHRAEPLEVRGGQRGRPAHRRLRRHQQDADAVERTRLLRQRPRRQR